jgi:hypothetical protein
MAKPAQGFFKFNAGKKYKFRGPHPASKEAKEHTKKVDAFLAGKSQPEVAKAPEVAPEKTEKEKEARKKYLDELKNWRDD